MMNIGPVTSSPSAVASTTSSTSSMHHHHHHHQYGSNATDMSRSTFPSSYYESFYAANGAPAAAWGAYQAAAGYQTSAAASQAAAAVAANSAAAVAANNCLLGTSAPKSLVNTHFSTVHSQRRKRRVLFTQAQVNYHELSFIVIILLIIYYSSNPYLGF